MASLNVPRRFCGPPDSANGGYFAGAVAALAGASVAVRLIKPPPLDTELEVTEAGKGSLEVRSAGELIASTRPDRVTAPQLTPPAYFETVEASRRYSGFERHPFPTCFVCGPQRARGDGLRVFSGPLRHRALVAAPWVADGSLDAGDGKVRPEFMWAALDCPGWSACLPDGRAALLAELSAHVDRRVHIDERCFVVGWRIGGSGRKHEAGTALYDEDGELCAYARALWIEPRG
jgi:hypothetical protein